MATACILSSVSFQFFVCIEKLKASILNSIRWMRQQRFGNSVSDSDIGNIYKLSNYNLSEVKNLVLAHGLDFCLPPTHPT